MLAVLCLMATVQAQQAVNRDLVDYAVNELALMFVMFITLIMGEFARLKLQKVRILV